MWAGNSDIVFVEIRDKRAAARRRIDEIKKSSEPWSGVCQSFVQVTRSEGVI